MIKQVIYRNREVMIKDPKLAYVQLSNGEIFYTDKVKDVQRYRKGDMIAYKEESTNKVFLGFSVCHQDDLKWYSKDVGYQLALEVADKSYDLIEVPKAIEEDLAYFTKRCFKYFKQPELPEWATKLMDKYCYQEIIKVGKTHKKKSWKDIVDDIRKPVARPGKPISSIRDYDRKKNKKIIETESEEE